MSCERLPLPSGPRPPAATGSRDGLRGNRLFCGDRTLEFRGGRTWHSTYSRRSEYPVLTTLSYDLGGDRLAYGGGRFKVRGCGFNCLGCLGRRPVCPALGGPRCGSGGDRLTSGGGRLEFRGHGRRPMCPAPRCGFGGDGLVCGGRRQGLRGCGGLDRGPVCPAPSGTRCGFGGDRLICGGGRLWVLRGCGDILFRGLDRGPRCPAPSGPR